MLNNICKYLNLLFIKIGFLPQMWFLKHYHNAAQKEILTVCGVCNPKSSNLRNGKPKKCSQLSYWFWRRTVQWIMTKAEKTASDSWSRKLCQRHCWIMHVVKCHLHFSNLCKSWDWRIPGPLILPYKMKKKWNKPEFPHHKWYLQKDKFTKLTGFFLVLIFFFFLLAIWDYRA